MSGIKASGCLPCSYTWEVGHGVELLVGRQPLMDSLLKDCPGPSGKQFAKEDGGQGLLGSTPSAQMAAQTQLPGDVSLPGTLQRGHTPRVQLFSFLMVVTPKTHLANSQELENTPLLFLHKKIIM